MNRTAQNKFNEQGQAETKRCLDATAKFPVNNSMAAYVVSQNPKLTIDEAKEILHCLGG